MKTQLKSILAAFAALSFTSAAHAANAGILAAVENDVKVVLPGGKVLRAGLMQSLPENSRVQVGAGGRAVVVLFHDGSRYALNGGSVAAVATDGLTTVTGPAPARLPALRTQKAKRLRGSRVAYGRAASVSIRGEELELQTLAGGATLDERPTFKWSPVKDAVSYKIRLFDEQDRQIFERETTGTVVSYPADARPLKAEVQYVWRVSTVVRNTAKTNEGTFYILSAKQKQELQADLDALKDPESTEAPAAVDPLDAVVQAEVYAAHDLTDKAIGIYEQLIAKYPESAAFHSTLAELLGEQRRSVSANYHEELADKLSGEVAQDAKEVAKVQN